MFNLGEEGTEGEGVNGRDERKGENYLFDKVEDMREGKAVGLLLPFGLILFSLSKAGKLGERMFFLSFDFLVLQNDDI